MELPSNAEVSKRIGDFATKHQLRVGYHLHTTATMTAWDQAMAQSPMNGIQLDIGALLGRGHEPHAPIPGFRHDTLGSGMALQRGAVQTARGPLTPRRPCTSGRFLRWRASSNGSCATQVKITRAISPQWDNLHADPRFSQCLARMGLASQLPGRDAVSFPGQDGEGGTGQSR